MLVNKRAGVPATPSCRLPGRRRPPDQTTRSMSARPARPATSEPAAARTATSSAVGSDPVRCVPTASSQSLTPTSARNTPPAMLAADLPQSQAARPSACPRTQTREPPPNPGRIRSSPASTPAGAPGFAVEASVELATALASRDTSGCRDRAPEQGRGPRPCGSRGRTPISIRRSSCSRRSRPWALGTHVMQMTSHDALTTSTSGREAARRALHLPSRLRRPSLLAGSAGGARP